MLVDHRAKQRTVAGMPLRRGRLDRPHPCNVTHRSSGRYRVNVPITLRFRRRFRGDAPTKLSWRRRSCGNVSSQGSPPRPAPPPGCVLTGTILWSRVEEAEGHIQQAIDIAVDTNARCRLLLGIPARVRFGGWPAELILCGPDGRDHQRGFVFGQPGPKLDHAVLTLVPVNLALGDSRATVRTR